MIFDVNRPSLDALGYDRPYSVLLHLCRQSTRRRLFPKVLFTLHTPIFIIVNPYLLIARNRRIAFEIILRLKPHRRVCSTKHGVWQVASVRQVVHAEIEPNNAIMY
jgi:hypothetical protein